MKIDRYSVYDFMFGLIFMLISSGFWVYAENIRYQRSLGNYIKQQQELIFELKQRVSELEKANAKNPNLESR